MAFDCSSSDSGLLCIAFMIASTPRCSWSSLAISGFRKTRTFSAAQAAISSSFLPRFLSIASAMLAPAPALLTFSWWTKSSASWRSTSQATRSVSTAFGCELMAPKTISMPPSLMSSARCSFPSPARRLTSEQPRSCMSESSGKSCTAFRAGSTPPSKTMRVRRSGLSATSSQVSTKACSCTSGLLAWLCMAPRAISRPPRVSISVRASSVPSARATSSARPQRTTTAEWELTRMAWIVMARPLSFWKRPWLSGSPFVSSSRARQQARGTSMSTSSSPPAGASEWFARASTQSSMPPSFAASSSRRPLSRARRATIQHPCFCSSVHMGNWRIAVVTTAQPPWTEIRRRACRPDAAKQRRRPRPASWISPTPGWASRERSTTSTQPRATMRVGPCQLL
mmetsp:Transcript_36456/g.108344  ORF Transcript_36456/g.108344 Transcript_36456/m.108344 type:complete len:397 (-) Transcript_36456:89-1279(-)